MDVGLFKASKTRMVLWIVVPPMLITAVGLSSFALKQRAEWRLKQTRALSNVLPDVIRARKNVQNLVDNLGLSEERRITTGDQLITLLDEKAAHRNIELKRTQIVQREQNRNSSIPVISAVVEASGDFAGFQLFLNDVKSAHPLISARTIELTQGREDALEEGFQLKVVFDLLLANDVLKATGGSI